MSTFVTWNCDLLIYRTTLYLIMKNILSFVAVAMIAMVACDKQPADNTQKVAGTMTITSERQLKYSFVGGAGEITYTLEGAVEGAKPTVKSVEPWITNLSVDESITFDVERSTVQQERTAVITITHGKQEEIVLVKQDAAYDTPDVEFEAKALNGEYSGKTNSGAHNYFIVLSEEGITGRLDYSKKNNYRLSLCSDVAPANLNYGSASVLPVGIYHFDSFSMGDGGTLQDNSSWYVELKEDGSLFETKYSNGIVIVTEQGIEAYLTLTDNTTHHVVYEGPLGMAYLPIPEPDHYTSLTEDYIFEHKGFTSQIFYYGDLENVGLGNWIISAANNYENMNGDYLKVDVYLDSLDYEPELIYGEYEAVATSAELKGGTFLGGVEGSWLYGTENDDIVYGTIAPLVAGKIKIEKSGSGALITVDCVDDLGHKVAGTFECPFVQFHDVSM